MHSNFAIIPAMNTDVDVSVILRTAFLAHSRECVFAAAVLFAERLPNQISRGGATNNIVTDLTDYLLSLLLSAVPARHSPVRQRSYRTVVKCVN